MSTDRFSRQVDYRISQCDWQLLELKSRTDLIDLKRRKCYD